MAEDAKVASPLGMVRRLTLSSPWKLLLEDRQLLLLDLALLVTAILLVLTDAKVLFFHMIFILLTLGAFYWKLYSFVLHASVWVTITSIVVLLTVLGGGTQAEELIELPLLTTILVLVFAIARQREQAVEALRRANEGLENRIEERTAELTRINTRLTQEVVRHNETYETLRESEERYRRLVELSFEAIAINRDGIFLHLNRQMARLLGAASPEELIDRPIRDFVHPEYWDVVEARLRELGEEKKGVPLIEQKLIGLDGRIIDVEAASVPITYQGQQAVLSVVHDITARKQAEAERERERARVAHDLHASLAQSLAFLQLKLEEMTDNSDATAKIEELRPDLIHMRTVAIEAYDVVRGMLAAMLPSNSDDLAVGLLARAKLLSQRSGFGVRLTSEGTARPLSPVVRQQIVYLFQEALNNVEKHADAQHVDISLTWCDDALTVTLTDDGKGFEPDEIGLNGHFGLRIMQERAREIKGRLRFVSSPGDGTGVSLWLPLDPVPKPPFHEVSEDEGVT